MYYPCVNKIGNIHLPKNVFETDTYSLLDLAFVCLDFDGELVDETGKLSYLTAVVVGLGDNFLVLTFVFAHVGGGLTETSLLSFKFSLQVADLNQKYYNLTTGGSKNFHIFDVYLITFNSRRIQKL